MTAAPRYEWERAIRRAKIGMPLKGFALLVATYANKDGTSVHPGEAELAAVAEQSERNVRTKLAALRDSGWLVRTESGSDSGRRGRADAYVLSIPVEHRKSASGDPDQNTGSQLPVVAQEHRKSGDRNTGSSAQEHRKSGDRNTGSGLPPTNTRPTQGTNTETTPPLDAAAVAGATEATESDRFREFWEAWPRKISWLYAKQCWDAAIKRGVDPDHMINAARRYAESVAGQDIEFVSTAGRWLNGGGYDDEPTHLAGFVSETQRFCEY